MIEKWQSVFSVKFQTSLTHFGQALKSSYLVSLQQLRHLVQRFQPTVGGAITLGGQALNQLANPPNPVAAFEDNNSFIKFKRTI